MQIIVNGEIVQVNDDITLEQLLKNYDLDPDHVVVEHNKNIVPKVKFADSVLQGDDVLEILHFVGGG